MTAAQVEDYSLEEEQSDSEMAMTVAVLEERVNVYIKIVWALMGVGFAWLIAISLVLYHMNGTMNRVEQAQANAPARIVASLLNQSAPTRGSATENLNAAATVLKTAKLGKQKPTPEALKSVFVAIQRAQVEYHDLPALWSATAQFIDYKSRAVLPQSAEEHIAGARSLSCQSIYSGPPVVFSGCTLDLEGIKVTSGQPIIFIDSVVRYSGGAIALNAPSLRFQNCVFEFDVFSVPPPRGMQMMEALASSVGPQTEVPFS